MPSKKHHIKLTDDERNTLTSTARSRKAAAFKVQRAKALLTTDIGSHGPALTDREAALASGLSESSIERLRARACEVGPLGALERKKRDTPPVAAKVTDKLEAHMVQIACSEAPVGQESWTMELIAERLVTLHLVDSISGETVRKTLKKTRLNLGKSSDGAARRKVTPHS